MRLHILPFTLSVLALSACAPDPEQAALEQYLSEGEEIADSMNETGTKFETLMNVQGDIAAWTQAEKAELMMVVEEFTDLQTHAEAMNPPMILKDIHPTLIESIAEMRSAVDEILIIANNPSKMTEKAAADMEAHATKGEALADEYLQKMEQAINDAYPDMMEE